MQEAPEDKGPIHFQTVRNEEVREMGTGYYEVMFCVSAGVCAELFLWYFAYFFRERIDVALIIVLLTLFHSSLQMRLNVQSKWKR